MCKIGPNGLPPPQKTPQPPGAVWAELGNKPLRDPSVDLLKRGGYRQDSSGTGYFSFSKLRCSVGSGKGFWIKGLTLPLRPHPSPRHLLPLRPRSPRSPLPRRAGPYRSSRWVGWRCGGRRPRGFAPRGGVRSSLRAGRPARLWAAASGANHEPPPPRPCAATANGV